MAETSKNKIYYNDNENSAADVLADMKKLAQSTDDAIEKSKYNDTQIKKDISNMKTEITAKDNAQDNKILQLQTEKAELEKELKEAQEDFYQNSIRGQASGEYIHVEDSSNCRARIGVGGNSEQETREGYNLLNFKKWKDNNVSWNLGKNIVYGDNYVSGTSEGTDCYSNTVNEQYRFNCEPNTTYTLFYINDNSIMCRPIAFVYDSESKNIQTLELGLSADNIIIRRFTTSSEAGKMAIRLGTNVNGVNFKFSNIMILKGNYDKSTIPNYEQYGASPSPDYPSEVESCGDNINIFDKDNANILNAFFHKDNTVIIAKDNRKIIWTECKPNKNYTISLEENINIANKIALGYTTEIPKIGKQVYSISSIANNIQTINTGNDAKYLVAYVYSENYTMSFEDIINSIKIVEGTETGEYSPYGQGCINEVICNKNFFDINNPKYLNGYGLEDTGFFERGDQRTYIIPILQNNEEISVSYTKTLKGTRYYAFSDEIPTGVNSSHYGRIMFANSSDTGKITFTAKNNNYKYLLLGITKSEVFTDLQVEQNPTATSYEEHKEQTYTIPVQQPMRSVGDTRDTFIKKNNKWYERHYIARKIFDGSEKFTVTTGWGNTTYQIIINGMASPNSNSIMGKALCSHFTIKSGSDMYYNTSENAFAICSGNILRIRNIDIITLDDFKAWLTSQYNAGTPVYVDYVLETPLDIECTEEQSKILEELNNARTYKNVTNIYSTDEISPILSLDYAKDLETLLTSKESEV